MGGGEGGTENRGLKRGVAAMLRTGRDLRSEKWGQVFDQNTHTDRVKYNCTFQTHLQFCSTRATSTLTAKHTNQSVTALTAVMATTDSDNKTGDSYY